MFFMNKKINIIVFTINTINRLFIKKKVIVLKNIIYFYVSFMIFDQLYVCYREQNFIFYPQHSMIFHFLLIKLFIRMKNL